MPTIVSETATHKIAPVVISTLRRRLLPVSLATYSSESANFRLLAVAVDAAVLVAHDRAPVELDHPLAHPIDDAPVVGGHDHGGTGPVDAVQKPHDALRGRGVQVARRLVGQQYRAVG